MIQSSAARRRCACTATATPKVARGHRGPAGPARAGTRPLRLRPPEPLLRGPAVRRRGLGRAQALRRSPRACRLPRAARDRLLRARARAPRRRRRCSTRPSTTPASPPTATRAQQAFMSGAADVVVGHQRVRDGRRQGRHRARLPRRAARRASRPTTRKPAAPDVTGSRRGPSCSRHGAISAASCASSARPR